MLEDSSQSLQLMQVVRIIIARSCPAFEFEPFHGLFFQIPPELPAMMAPGKMHNASKASSRQCGHVMFHYLFRALHPINRSLESPLCSLRYVSRAFSPNLKSHSCSSGHSYQTPTAYRLLDNIWLALSCLKSRKAQAVSSEINAFLLAALAGTLGMRSHQLFSVPSLFMLRQKVKYCN